MGAAEARAALVELQNERISVKAKIAEYEIGLHSLRKRLDELEGTFGQRGAIYRAKQELEHQERIAKDINNFPVRFNTMKRELYSNEKTHTQLVFLKETPKSFKYREVGSEEELVLWKDPGKASFPFYSDVNEFLDWIKTNFGKGE